MGTLQYFAAAAQGLMVCAVSDAHRAAYSSANRFK